MISNSLKADLALKSKSKCYPSHQENLLPQNRFLLATLQFKHFRVLLLRQNKTKPTITLQEKKGGMSNT